MSSTVNLEHFTWYTYPMRAVINFALLLMLSMQGITNTGYWRGIIFIRSSIDMMKINAWAWDLRTQKFQHLAELVCYSFKRLSLIFQETVVNIPRDCRWYSNRLSLILQETVVYIPRDCRWYSKRLSLIFQENALIFQETVVDIPSDPSLKEGPTIVHLNHLSTIIWKVWKVFVA